MRSARSSTISSPDALHPTGGRLLLRSPETTDWRTGRKGCLLTVADTGAGISPHVLTKMYDAFYTTNGIGGTGLGLWVSQEIVHRHHGRLRARSAHGRTPARNRLSALPPLRRGRTIGQAAPSLPPA